MLALGFAACETAPPPPSDPQAALIEKGTTTADLADAVGDLGIVAVDDQLQALARVVVVDGVDHPFEAEQPLRGLEHSTEEERILRDLSASVTARAAAPGGRPRPRPRCG